MIQTNVENKKTTIWTSLGPNPTIEKDIPEDQVWIDDAVSYTHLTLPTKRIV